MSENNEPGKFTPGSVFVILGGILCALSWLTMGVLPALEFLIFLYLPLTAYVTWKEDKFPSWAASFFLISSMVGIILEAVREEGIPVAITSRAEDTRPLRGDDDGLWLLVFPFIIFWWFVARTVGYIIYRIANRKKSLPAPSKTPMRILRVFIICVVIFVALIALSSYYTQRKINSPEYKAFLEAMNYRPAFDQSCNQGTTGARHIATGTILTFGSDCLPPGWEKIDLPAPKSKAN